MTKTKTKAGRSGARKTAARKTSTTTDTTDTSTVAADAGLDAKQQSALERGGSLAQRNSSEPTLAPGPDKPSEITSAAPPNVPALDEPGRASSPSFDETPVTGKGKTGTKAGPKDQKVKAGEGEAADEGKVADIHKLEDLPVGTTIEIRADSVVLSVAVAGGSRKTFVGTGANTKTRVKTALAEYNAFAESGPALFATAAPIVTDAELDQSAKDAHARSLEDLKARGIEAD